MSKVVEHCAYAGNFQKLCGDPLQQTGRHAHGLRRHSIDGINGAEDQDDNDEIDIAISRNGSDGYETQTRAAIEQVKGPFQRRARWIICGWGGRG